MVRTSYQLYYRNQVGMAKKKAAHGGKRPGAGRKPKGVTVPVRTLRASDEDWDTLKKAAAEAGLPVTTWLLNVGLKSALWKR